MSDDGWGDDDAGWKDGDAAAAPAAGDDDDEEVEEEEKPRGGGDGKCRNCKKVLKILFLGCVLFKAISRKGTLLPTAQSQRCVVSVER